MFKKSSLYALFAIVGIFAMVLTACGGAKPTTPPPAANQGFSVGVVLPTKDEPRWIPDETRFTDAFKASGDSVQILFSQGDSAKEKTNVESLIAQGVKVIIICPQDGTAAAAAAAEARAAGVKVVSYDRLILDTDAVDYYVTFDSIAVGKAQGQYLVDKATGTGNPLYLYAGAASDNNAFLFFQGAWSVLQPKIADGTFVIKNSSEAVGLQSKATLTRDEEGKIIGQVTTDWKFDVAKNLAEANLTAAKAADKGNVFILAPNDGTSRSIADTFAADTAVQSYVITGQDAEEPSIQYIIDGKQSMTVLKDVRTLVADAITAAVAYLKGSTPEKTTTYNNGKIDVPAKPSVVITVDKTNVKAAVIDSGYWPAADFKNVDQLGKLSVGVVLPTKDEPRWIQDETRFSDAFKAAGQTVQILFSQGNSATEKANVETLIAKGIKVLIICPQDGAAAAAAADEAHAAGVKVISYDRLILNTASVDYYVTFDSVAVGAAQAQYLVDKATGKNNPLYLYAGAATDNNAFLFFQGAWGVLQPKIADGTFVIKNSSEAVGLQDKATLTRDEEAKIIGQVTTDWKFDVAKNLAQANLTAAKPEDKGNVFILAPNDGTARSIADTFAADTAVTSYVVTGQDAEEASVQYIIDGKQSMTVLKDVRTLVADAISAAQAFLKGQTPPKTTTYNNGTADIPAKPSVVITVDQSNVKAAIIDSGYWPAADFKNLDQLGKLSVGVVLPTKDEPRWIQDETRFNDAFKAAGNSVQILFSQGTSATEKANVEALIAQGIKVLIICPQDGAAAAAAADEAHAAGVKVISYDRLILNTASVDYYVTFDSVAVGAAQAQYLVDKATGKNNPLYLYAGAATDNNAFLFFQGAWGVLQPKIADGTFVIKNSSEAVGLQDKATLTRDEEAKIIGQITTDWKFDVAKNLAQANLTAAKPEDKGNVFILAPNDGTARSIADTFAADTAVTSYVVTGQDAEEASVQYIIDGKQSMTVLKDVRTLVADAISAAQAFL